MTRPNYVKAIAYNENMEAYEIEATELLARAICHETDHLDGELYVSKVEGQLMDTEEYYEEMDRDRGKKSRRRIMAVQRSLECDAEANQQV